MSEIAFVSPCCGKPLHIKHIDEIRVIPPNPHLEWDYWKTNALCCAELGSGLYRTREAAEGSLGPIRESVIDASIREAREKLKAKHEQERRDLELAIEDFAYFNSAQYEQDCAGPAPGGGSPGFSEACGYRD